MSYHDIEGADTLGRRILDARAAARGGGAHEKWEMRGQEDLLLGLRHCWFCGGLHPLDLERMFQENKVVSYSGSDWKYGWPHKFYLDIATGVPAESVYTIYPDGFSGENSKREVSKEEWTAHQGSKGSGTRPGTGNVHAKFYTGHLQDLERGEEFGRVTQLVFDKFRIWFGLREGKLTYSAPSAGFQVSWPERKWPWEEQAGAEEPPQG